MGTKDVERLAKLADEIEAVLAQPMTYSKQFFRGDLRVLMKAAREVQRREPISAHMKGIKLSIAEIGERIRRRQSRSVR